jgi:Rnl2 family RNA ligase
VYTPELEFEAFDLFYETESNKSNILNYKQACELFEKVGLPYGHILAEGTLLELMSTLNAETFKSTIYAKHGLPKVDGNLAEGYVLKPNDAAWIDGQRLSIKLKNSRHLESVPKVKEPKAAPVKKEVTVSAEEQEIIDRCLAYITLERMSNIATKLTDDERSEKTINKMMIADAWKDL